MEKADERRTERRLRYRWPVRFARDPRDKPLSGQMFDLSSKGMAMLFHANEECPGPDQSITANFGVPHFDAHGSFDTAFFNRVGRICRVDELTSRVNRVAIQFAEPLFFAPGEQDISESEAQRRLQAKARSIIKARRKKIASAGTSARAERKVRIDSEGDTSVRENLAAKIKAEARARKKAEAKVKSQATLKDKAEERARTEADRRAAAEADARENARLYEREIAKVRAEATREIARLKDEASYKIAEAKAEVRAKLLAKAKAREKEKKQEKKEGRKSGKGGLVKKVDEFITDRSQIY
jgi:hypothetical protein